MQTFTNIRDPAHNEEMKNDKPSEPDLVEQAAIGNRLIPGMRAADEPDATWARKLGDWQILTTEGTGEGTGETRKRRRMDKAAE
jgi:hypothetical protein